MRFRRRTAAWLAALALLPVLGAVALATRIDRGEILTEMRERGLLGPDAHSWDQSQWDLFWRLRKAEREGAVDLLAKRLPHHENYVVRLYVEGRGYRILLNAKGYEHYHFIKSQDAIRAFEVADIPLKGVFHLVDSSGSPFFDSQGQLTDAGEEGYDALARGDPPNWRYDWQPAPAPPPASPKRPDSPEAAALKSSGYEELDPTEELWLTKVTVCTDEQLTHASSLRILKGRSGVEPRYFMSPKDPMFALIGRYRSGDRQMVSAVGSASFGQGRGQPLRIDLALTLAKAAVALLASCALLGAVLVVLREEMSPALAAGVAAAVASLPAFSADLAWARGFSPNLSPLPFVSGPLLLMGLGWPGAALLHRAMEGRSGVRFRLGSWVEVLTLLFAALHGFLLAFKGATTLLDTGLLAGAFVFYLLLAARLEPAHSGESDWLSVLRRIEFPVAGAFTGAALVLCGVLTVFGWWILRERPVFSGPWAAGALEELPVFLTVFLLIARGRAQAGLRLLVAAQVLQATLGVALIPVAALLTRGLLVQTLTSPQIAGVALAAAATFYAALSLSGLALRLSEALPLAFLAAAAMGLGGYLDSYELGAIVLGGCALLVARRRSETGKIFPGGA